MGATTHNDILIRVTSKFSFVKLTPFPIFVSIVKTIIQSAIFMRSFFTILSRGLRPNGVSANDVKWMSKSEVGYGNQDDDAER